MLKWFFPGLLLICCMQPALAQVVDASRTYQDLLAAARQQHKWLYLSVNQGDSIHPTSLMDRETAQRWSEQFVTGELSVDDVDIDHPLRQRFDFSRPIQLVLDADGFPLLRWDSTLNRSQRMESLLDSVARVAAGETIGGRWQQFQRGVRNRKMLKALLEQYRDFNMYTDQRVLAAFLSQLSVAELDNFETVVFLLQCGPIYESKTYRLARANAHMVDSLFGTLPLKARMDINGRMIRNTYRKALTDRDSHLIRSLGGYIRGSWGNNPIRGGMGGDFYWMDYHRCMRDTTIYLNAARRYYNQYYLMPSTDSLAKMDYADQIGKEIPAWVPVLDSLEEIGFQNWFAQVLPRYQKSDAHALYAAAHQFVEFARDDPPALFDAVRWMRRAIELTPGSAAYHQVLAALLYRLAFYEESTHEQQTAVQLAEASQLDTGSFEARLDSIRARRF